MHTCNSCILMHQRRNPNTVTLCALVCYSGGLLVTSIFQIFAIKNETKKQSPKRNKTVTKQK